MNRVPARRRHAPVLLALVPVVVLAAGCTSAAWKRGASPTGIAAAEAECRVAKPTGADVEGAFDECMRAGGLSVFRPARTAEAIADNSRPALTTTDVRVDAVDTAPRALSGDREVATSPNVPAEYAALAPKHGVQQLASGSALETVGVSSWWQRGGSPAALDAAAGECVETLGPAHQPDVALTRITPALRDCLRAAGWRAFGR